MNHNMTRLAALFLSLTIAAGSSAMAASDLSAPEITEALMKLDTDETASAPAVSAGESADASDLPSKIDLRDRGIVPPVRDQTPWGTCWGFGSIAASEISILSELGLTCDQFKEKYGYDLDLSERHLAWFGTSHMPVVTESDEDASEMDITQSEEGIHNIAEDSDPNAAHFELGGLALTASSIFAAGFGPVLESDVPYTANDGSLKSTSDWSVSEEYRFITAFDLLESSLLPSPAQKDAKTGEYTYDESATNAIKQELNAGHAVAISYHGDISEPSQLEKNQTGRKTLKASSSDDTTDWDSLKDEILEMGFDEEEAEIALSVMENGSYDDLTDDERFTAAEVYIYWLSDDDDYEELLDELYDGDIASEDILDEVVSGVYEADGYDEDGSSDEYTEESGETEVQYIDTTTYAQYTYDANAEVDHVVCIIGYDDDYAVSNFLEGHQPPAAGAWICRNSWGADWGLDGYFYLSYYDMTISEPESFVFDVTDIDKQTDDLTILNYDFMQTEESLAATPEGTAAQACVFDTDEESVLTNAGLFTAVQDTDVTLSVYLLSDNAKTPEDGTLLDEQTLHFPYAGFHRVKLTGNYVIPESSRISIVTSQTCKTDSGETSILPVNMALTKEGMEEMSGSELTAETPWFAAKVNEGESFVCDNGTWSDWKTVLDETEDVDPNFYYYAIDNPRLKLYMYPMDEMQDIHDLDETVTDADGNTVSVCSEDDYTVIYQ